MHNSITQSVLGASGHHLLNRYFEGTLEEHLAGWGTASLVRAGEEIEAEMGRVDAYLSALKSTHGTVIREIW